MDSTTPISGKISGYSIGGQIEFSGNAPWTIEKCRDSLYSSIDTYNADALVKYREHWAKEAGRPSLANGIEQLWAEWDTQQKHCKYFVTCNGSTDCNSSRYKIMNAKAL